MTRFLSESLQAPEPFFRLGLKRLEAANGNPSTDIRFSSDVMQTTRAKLPLLGLDPKDTTPEELYHALQERIKHDDAALVKTLRTTAATHISAEGDIVAGMVHALKHLPESRRCFAIKSSSFRALIKKLPPKKTMKRLGYRSMDSFLKHETPVTILTAATLSEGDRWHEKLLDQYKRLKPRDFESRTIAIETVSFKRWPELAESVVAVRKHNVLVFKELGAVVILPFPENTPSGAATASLSLSLQGLNEIRAASTFLRLAVVRADFGTAARTVATEEPQLASELLDQTVPWHLIQRFYAEHKHLFSEALFEPHIRFEDMAWEPVEKALASIEPSFGFWHQSAHLGMPQGHAPVSCNVIDVALNYCNELPFEKRLSHYFRHSLWQELLMKYLRPASVEETVLSELQPALVTEPVEV